MKEGHLMEICLAEVKGLLLLLSQVYVFPFKRSTLINSSPNKWICLEYHVIPKSKKGAFSISF